MDKEIINTCQLIMSLSGKSRVYLNILFLGSFSTLSYTNPRPKKWDYFINMKELNSLGHIAFLRMGDNRI